jgi:hypothetical protein
MAKVKYPDEKGITYPWKTEIIPNYVIPFLMLRERRA